MFGLKLFHVVANRQYYKIFAVSAEEAAESIAQSCKNGDIISVLDDRNTKHRYEVLDAYRMITKSI